MSALLLVRVDIEIWYWSLNKNTQIVFQNRHPVLAICNKLRGLCSLALEMERETIKRNHEPKLGIGTAISNICTFCMVAWSYVQVHVSLIIVFECNIVLSVQAISCTEYLAVYFYLGNKSFRGQTLMRRLFSLLFFRSVVGIERFTLKPRFLPLRVDAPRGVLRISSDGGWSNGAKIKTQKNP